MRGSPRGQPLAPTSCPRPASVPASRPPGGPPAPLQTPASPRPLTLAVKVLAARGRALPRGPRAQAKTNTHTTQPSASFLPARPVVRTAGKGRGGRRRPHQGHAEPPAAPGPARGPSLSFTSWRGQGTQGCSTETKALRAQPGGGGRGRGPAAATPGGGRRGWVSPPAAPPPAAGPLACSCPHSQEAPRNTTEVRGLVCREATPQPRTGPPALC